MAMVDLGNSDKSKSVAPATQTPKTRPLSNAEIGKEDRGVANGSAEKESLGEKIFRTFIPADPKKVAEDALMKVILPGLRNAIFNGISAFFGFNPISPSGTATTTSQNIPYNKVRPWEGTVTPVRSGYGVSRIFYGSAQEAVDVLNVMKQTLNERHVVTVADYYEFSRCEQIYTTDYNYGWVNLDSARIMEDLSRGKYYIELPESRQLAR